MLRSAPVVRFVFSVLAIFSIFSLTAVAQQPPLPVPLTMSTIAGTRADDASCRGRLVRL